MAIPKYTGQPMETFNPGKRSTWFAWIIHQTQFPLSRRRITDKRPTYQRRDPIFAHGSLEGTAQCDCSRFTSGRCRRLNPRGVANYTFATTVFLFSSNALNVQCEEPSDAR